MCSDGSQVEVITPPHGYLLSTFPQIASTWLPSEHISPNRLHMATIWTHFPKSPPHGYDLNTFPQIASTWLPSEHISPHYCKTRSRPPTFDIYRTTLYCIVFSGNFISTWRWSTQQWSKHVVETFNNTANIVVLRLLYPRLVIAIIGSHNGDDAT
jgi:hypothetical protein